MTEPLMNITMGELLHQMAVRYPDREMVKYTDRDYRRTWKEFDEEADRVARGFLGMGVKKGDHVAIWATNVPEWILTLFATAKIGAILVTVNTSYKIFEAEYLLRQSDAKVLVMMEASRTPITRRSSTNCAPRSGRASPVSWTTRCCRA